MKYFDITLPKDIGGLTYPYKYNSEIAPYVVDHLYYKVDEAVHLLVAIKDVNAGNIARASVVLVAEAEAKAICDANERTEVMVNSEATVRLIELKVAKGETLTADEEKAIDPDDDSSVGFTRHKRMYDRISSIAAAELIS